MNFEKAIDKERREDNGKAETSEEKQEGCRGSCQVRDELDKVSRNRLAKVLNVRLRSRNNRRVLKALICPELMTG